MPPREPKLQRWTDLIAALLRRTYAATFEELARDVPAHADESKKRDTVMRMFERDKDELRSFGIDLLYDDGDPSGYRLDRKGFYLPYLSLASREGKPGSQPRRPDKHWYRAPAFARVRTRRACYHLTRRETHPRTRRPGPGRRS